MFMEGLSSLLNQDFAMLSTFADRPDTPDIINGFVPRVSGNMHIHKYNYVK